MNLLDINTGNLHGFVRIIIITLRGADNLNKLPKCSMGIIRIMFKNSSFNVKMFGCW